MVAVNVLAFIAYSMITQIFLCQAQNTQESASTQITKEDEISDEFETMESEDSFTNETTAENIAGPATMTSLQVLEQTSEENPLFPSNADELNVTLTMPDLTTPEISTSETIKSMNNTSITCPNITLGKYFFPESTAGSWITPTDICLDDDYTLLTIKCLNNGTWNSTRPISCSPKPIRNTTEELYTILGKNSTSAIKVANDVVMKNATDLTPVDIYLISEILNKASGDVSFVEEFVETINNVMNAEKKILDESQELYNSTDTILYSLDTLLLNSGNVNFTMPNLFIHTVTSDKIYGALITSKQNGNFSSFEVEYLYDRNYKDKLNNTNFEMAVILSPSVDHYFITLFQNDNLFPQKSNETVGSWIVSILLPNIADANSQIKIYFKEFQRTLVQKCDHWKYGMENNIAIKGEWNSDSNATEFKSGYYVCEINHTTHFGLLVSGSAPDNFVLDLITIFGSILSLIGIIIIFLTALVFKKWRSKANSKIILNVSFCMLILIILFIISDKANKGAFCISVGLMLHYIVLAQFCWALIISYSSYRRFHTVFSEHIDHVVIKYCAFSWGVPLIIVIITSIINIQTYDKSNDDNSSLCYPKEIYLKLGVCLPMTVILSINLIVYFLIIKALMVNSINIQKHEIKRSFSVQKSIILLFFMMGITWIFGLVVAFTDNILFLYLFCTTATFYGFVIFVFYVLDSDDVKQQWKNKLKVITKRKSKKSQKYEQHIGMEDSTTKMASE